MSDPRHNDEHHRKDDEKIELMYLALFGNKETKQKGMVETHQEMYDFFKKMDNGYSLAKWVIGSIIVAGLLFGTLKGWIGAFIHYLVTTK